MGKHSEMVEIISSKFSADIAQMSKEDIQRLLFDLQTHRVELQMQNEELNRAHLELTISRDNYAQLYDSLPIGYLTLNETGIIQNANAAALTLLGFSKPELINKSLGSLFDTSEQDNYYLFLRNLLAQKTDHVLNTKIKNIHTSPTQSECEYFEFCGELGKPCKKNNQLTYIECHARVVDDEKKVLQILLSMNDVTERKQKEETIACLNLKLEEKVRRQDSALTSTNMNLLKKVEELRNSKHRLVEREAKLNSIFNASVEGIITIDVSDTIVSANAAVETIFDYEPREIMGCNINKLMPLSPRAMNDCNLSRAVKLGGQIREIEGLRKDGSMVPLELSLAEFSIDQVNYITYIVRDVSPRKYREQKDKEHLDELAHVTRLGLMGEMASGIAHEVNQPLNAISTYIQVCLNLINTENPDLVKLTEIITKTRQQALRAGAIIHRMREFVKSHSKHRSTTNLNELIHNAGDLCTSELKQHDTILAFHLENNLPTIYVDQMQIEQVIINLVRNSVDALKDLPENQERKIIIDSRLTPDKVILVRVKDNGLGLNYDQQQKILTPFYTTKADGMGMGLSISRSIIESHKGNLYFNSLPEKGTTFYFTLPTEERL